MYKDEKCTFLKIKTAEKVSKNVLFKRQLSPPGLRPSPCTVWRNLVRQFMRSDEVHTENYEKNVHFKTLKIDKS